MERRTNQRVAVNQPTTLVILTEPQRDMAALVVNFSGTGMQIRVESPVEVSATVQVELADTLYFGEVCYCYEEAGAFKVGLVLEQVLTVTSDLTRLMMSLEGSATDQVNA